MLERFYKRYMSELGKELLSAMLRDDEWEVSDHFRQWEHKPSGVTLWFGDSVTRVVYVPNIEIAYEDRRKLLNFFDKQALRKRKTQMLRQYDDHKKVNATTATINLLRLSQHKGANNV